MFVALNVILFIISLVVRFTVWELEMGSCFMWLSAGMLLFPGEEACYAGKPGWKLRKTSAGTLLICPGDCARDERPLACRIFPLLPVIRNGEVKVAADQRARAVCPLLKQGIRGMDPAFAEAVREAGKTLAADAAQRAFLGRMTEEQDELKSLRDRLGGI